MLWRLDEIMDIEYLAALLDIGYSVLDIEFIYGFAALCVSW
jgi:hypothetical protein